MLEHLVRLRQRLVGLSITHPRVVVGATLLLTVAFGLQFPKIRIDTDPKNMLPETSQVRRYNDQVEGWFGMKEGSSTRKASGGSSGSRMRSSNFPASSRGT
jgi:predicted RND superfamily exporter protein